MRLKHRAEGTRSRTMIDLVSFSESWGDRCDDIVLTVRFRRDLQKNETRGMGSRLSKI